MFEHLFFTAFVNVRSDQKAHRVMNRLAESIEQTIHIEKLEKYWKDPKLYKVTFSVLLHQEDVATAVFETLQICSAIAIRWIITRPQSFSGGKWDFHGSAVERDIAIVGLKAICFEMRNYNPSETDLEGNV